MNPNSAIFVAGHRGMVGSALVRALQAKGFHNLLLKDRNALDLLDQGAVNRFFQENRVEAVFFCAAKVGGIYANMTQQADFLYQNLAMATHTIHAAAQHGVEKFLFLGSSCIYPKLAPQPIKEEYLLTGLLEPTNEGYAIAKIAGLKLCEMYQRQYGKRFISAMPTNLYGIGDNFHPENSHVIPALIRRFHEAAQQGADRVTIWGSGTPRREFLFVDDLAEALLVLMERYEGQQTVNVGTGEDQTILETARLIAEVVGFKGEIGLDASKPDGTPQKLLDVSRMKSQGWQPRHNLRQGLEITYRWALEHKVFQ